VQPSDPLGGLAGRPLGVAEQFRNDLAELPGVLPYIERRHVETEGPDAAEQACHAEETGVPAEVLPQAARDRLDVPGEGRRSFVPVVVVGEGRLEACDHELDEDPVAHVGMARRNGLRDVGEPARVGPGPPCQLFAPLHPGARLRELAGEPSEIVDVRRECDLAMTNQGATQGVRVHVRIPVHVAAHPRAGTQERGAGVARGDTDLRERRLEVFVKRRGHAIEHAGHVVEDVLAFVGHRRADRRVLLRLPRRGDRLPDHRPGGSLVVGGARRVEAVDQLACDPLLLVEDDAPRRLRRVSREDHLDAGCLEQRRDPLPGDSGRIETTHGVGQRSLLGRVRILHALPSTADPVYALGQVDDLEVGGERADDLLGPRRVESREDAREISVRRFDVGGPLAPANRDVAGLLDALEEIRAALLSNHRADEVAQLADVVAERLVLRWEGDPAEVGLSGHPTRAETPRRASSCSRIS
jgi:hypothetical protein